MKPTKLLLSTFLATLLLSSGNSYGQLTDSSFKIMSMEWGELYGRNENRLVYYPTSKRLEIHGDTIAAILNLLTAIKQKDSIYMELYKFVNAGIEFTNHVPDYWKSGVNNCKWPTYLYYMKRHGYVLSKNKQKSDCK